MGKVLLILVIVVSLATAGIGFLNKSKLSETKAELETAQSGLNASKTSLAKVEKELKEAKDQVATFNATSSETAAKIAASQAALEEAQQKADAAQKAVADKEAEVAQLKTTLEAANQQLAEAKASTVAPAVDQSAELKNQIAEKDQLLQATLTKLNQSEADLQTLRQAEQQRSQMKMRDGLQGRIVAVNPAWNFVVIDRGDRSGVINNAEMLVMRGSRMIGKVRITAVEPSTSVADIVANSVPKGLAIQPGDGVIFRSTSDN